jgi:hypothetical protein
MLTVRVSLGDRLLVPGDQPDRRLAGQRDQGVDAALADPDPVQLDVRDHRWIVGVGQHRALARGTGARQFRWTVTFSELSVRRVRYMKGLNPMARLP